MMTSKEDELRILLNRSIETRLVKMFSDSCCPEKWESFKKGLLEYILGLNKNLSDVHTYPMPILNLAYCNSFLTLLHDKHLTLTQFKQELCLSSADGVYPCVGGFFYSGNYKNIEVHYDIISQRIITRNITTDESVSFLVTELDAVKKHLNQGE